MVRTKVEGLENVERSEEFRLSAMDETVLSVLILNLPVCETVPFIHYQEGSMWPWVSTSLLCRVLAALFPPALL